MLRLWPMYPILLRTGWNGFPRWAQRKAKAQPFSLLLARWLIPAWLKFQWELNFANSSFRWAGASPKASASKRYRLGGLPVGVFLRKPSTSPLILIPFRRQEP